MVNLEDRTPSDRRFTRFQRTDPAEPEVAIRSVSPKTVWTAGGVLSGVARVLRRTEKPALLAALGLAVVWCLGRVMEAIHGNAVFDLTLTYWLGLVIFVLLALWVISLGTAALQDLGQSREKRLAAISWIFFGVMMLTVILSLKGFRTSAEGLFAALAGSAENTRQAIFLLFKFHWLNPMLVLNLGASKLMGTGWDVPSLAPYVWSWNALFVFFIWSLSFGIVILLQKDKLTAKSLHLTLAAFGLLGLIVLKAVSSPTPEQLIMIQAAAAIILVFQVLLAYATLRALAAHAVEEAPKPDPFRVSTPEKARPLLDRFVGLPPSALILALALFVLLPVLADLQNQFVLASSSLRIARQMSAPEGGNKTGYVAVTTLSVRSGPASGDRILGILPKGTSVQVLDRKNDYVKIGENKWIQEKFLRPAE